jgi:hypothetical protein
MMLLSKGKENPKNQKGSKLMKTLKVSLIAMVLTLTIIIGCAFALPAQAEKLEKERFIAIVINLDFENNSVIIISQDGNIWESDNPARYSFGDIVMVTVNTKGTAQYSDDEIIKVKKCGHISPEAVVVWFS